ncbi:MAG: hypothetical protein P8M17_00840 [Saprospiraceae bacterium]|nr:hypothetical protein [bacterium]MDB4443470.1 hypothetical protein [Saprospiraceae bacterium]MDG1433528.1 hypothetical protein [Saprospiraceae bacterium]MDG2417505.1 hypothetical protein [Saprospiraceae bacterium]
MQNLQKAFLFYFSLFTISIIIHGCCTNTYTIIGNGALRAYSIDEIYIPIDTIKGEFILRNEYETAFSGLGDFSIISSAMATSCAEEFTNTIDTISVQITCDQDFIFNGNTISAHSNFSHLGELKINFQQFYTNFLELHFKKSFLDKVTFENQEYTFTITSKTNDGLGLENKVTIFMNI